MHDNAAPGTATTRLLAVGKLHAWLCMLVVLFLALCGPMTHYNMAQLTLLC